MPAATTPPRLLVHLVLLGVSVLFGVNFVGMKRVLEAVPPLPWALLRISAATLILVPLTPRLAPGARLPGRRTMLLLIPASILGVGGNQLLFALGLQRTTPAHSSIIVTCVPILALGFAAMAGQERVTLRKVAAIGHALTGVLTQLEADRLFIGGGAARPDTLVGDLLTLLNMTGYAAFLVWMRHLGRGVAAGVSTAICFVYATLFVALFTLPDLRIDDYAGLGSNRVWPWAVFSVLGATVLAYLANLWALRHARSSEVALYIYVQPLVATLLSMGLGGGAPDRRFWLAAVAICAGVLISSTAPRRAAAVKSD